MYNLDYVRKKDAMQVRRELEQIINEVRNELRQYFTFQHNYIGSSKYNMITYDFKDNVGFDFDIDLMVNDEEENYNPAEIRCYLIRALNKVASKLGYSNCQERARSFTIKKIDRKNSRVLYSCDFAVVYNLKEGQQYIHFNKTDNTYSWQKQPQDPYKLLEKIKWLKENVLWNEVKEHYLYLKNNNTNRKTSRALFAETVNNVYNNY